MVMEEEEEKVVEAVVVVAWVVWCVELTSHSAISPVNLRCELSLSPISPASITHDTSEETVNMMAYAIRVADALSVC